MHWESLLIGMWLGMLATHFYQWIERSHRAYTEGWVWICGRPGCRSEVRAHSLDAIERESFRHLKSAHGMGRNPELKDIT